MRMLLTGLAVGAALQPFGSMAQDLSEEELLKLLLAQRDAYQAAVEGDAAFSRTRGLTLLTAEDVEISTEVAKGAAAATKTGETDGIATDPVNETIAATETVVASKETATLVKMPAELGLNVRIQFAFDSAALDKAQKPKLQTLCNVMKASDIQLLRIIGHTDSSGSSEYNDRLSRLRAEEVQRFFVKECGISSNRLEAMGLGERNLLEDLDPDSDQNRRVEFQALS